MVASASSPEAPPSDDAAASARRASGEGSIDAPMTPGKRTPELAQGSTFTDASDFSYYMTPELEASVHSIEELMRDLRTELQDSSSTTTAQTQAIVDFAAIVESASGEGALVVASAVRDSGVLDEYVPFMAQMYEHDDNEQLLCTGLSGLVNLAGIGGADTIVQCGGLDLMLALLESQSANVQFYAVAGIENITSSVWIAQDTDLYGKLYEARAEGIFSHLSDHENEWLKTCAADALVNIVESPARTWFMSAVRIQSRTRGMRDRTQLELHGPPPRSPQSAAAVARSKTRAHRISFAATRAETAGDAATDARVTPDQSGAREVEAAREIERVWRGHSARADQANAAAAEAAELKRSLAASYVQTTWHAHTTLRSFQEQRHAAVVIQAAQRRAVAQQLAAELRSAMQREIEAAEKARNVGQAAFDAEAPEAAADAYAPEAAAAASIAEPEAAADCDSDAPEAAPAQGEPRATVLPQTVAVVFDAAAGEMPAGGPGVAVATSTSTEPSLHVARAGVSVDTQTDEPALTTSATSPVAAMTTDVAISPRSASSDGAGASRRSAVPGHVAVAPAAAPAAGAPSNDPQVPAESLSAAAAEAAASAPAGAPAGVPTAKAEPTPLGADEHDDPTMTDVLVHDGDADGSADAPLAPAGDGVRDAAGAVEAQLASSPAAATLPAAAAPSADASAAPTAAPAAAPAAALALAAGAPERSGAETQRSAAEGDVEGVWEDASARVQAAEVAHAAARAATAPSTEVGLERPGEHAPGAPAAAATGHALTEVELPRPATDAKAGAGAAPPSPVAPPTTSVARAEVAAAAALRDELSALHAAEEPSEAWHGVPPPPIEPDYSELLARHPSELDYFTEPAWPGRAPARRADHLPPASKQQLDRNWPRKSHAGYMRRLTLEARELLDDQPAGTYTSKAHARDRPGSQHRRARNTLLPRTVDDEHERLHGELSSTLGRKGRSRSRSRSARRRSPSGAIGSQASLLSTTGSRAPTSRTHQRASRAVLEPFVSLIAPDEYPPHPPVPHVRAPPEPQGDLSRDGLHSRALSVTNTAVFTSIYGVPPTRPRTGVSGPPVYPPSSRSATAVPRTRSQPTPTVGGVEANFSWSDLPLSPNGVRMLHESYLEHAARHRGGRDEGINLPRLPAAELAAAREKRRAPYPPHALGAAPRAQSHHWAGRSPPPAPTLAW